MLNYCCRVTWCVPPVFTRLPDAQCVVKMVQSTSETDTRRMTAMSCASCSQKEMKSCPNLLVVLFILPVVKLFFNKFYVQLLQCQYIVKTIIINPLSR